MSFFSYFSSFVSSTKNFSFQSKVFMAEINSEVWFDQFLFKTILKNCTAFMLNCWRNLEEFKKFKLKISKFKKLLELDHLVDFSYKTLWLQNYCYHFIIGIYSYKTDKSCLMYVFYSSKHFWGTGMGRWQNRVMSKHVKNRRGTGVFKILSNI